MLDYLANFGQQNISITSLMVAIIFTALVGSGLVWVYQYTHRGLTYDRSFLVTLLLMAPIIALIITIIGNNIALSIGLVGSLSIIRFRTVIKDSRDLIYLLWAIAIGLGGGTGNLLATFSSCILIAGICILLHLIRYGQDIKRDYILVITGQNKDIEQHSIALLKAEGFQYRLRSMDKVSDNWQIVFEVKNKKDTEINLQSIMQRLEELPNLEKASLLAPNLTLPI